MKKIALFFILLIGVQLTYGQIEFNTGSSDLDKHLNGLNQKAKENLEEFKQEVVNTYKVKLPKVEELLEVMEPAEVILTNDIAKIVKKPIDDVVKSYKENKEKGWGEIAKEMGIKPGSPEFHALKEKLKGNKSKGKSKAKNKGKAKGKMKSKGKQGKLKK